LATHSRCPSVNVGVESIYCKARWSGEKRLPDVGRVELYPAFGGFEALPAGAIRPQSPRSS